MSYELWHTSAPKGLRGDSGFCTVKATRGLPVDVERQLARLSAYAHIFPPDANGNNPVAYNHVLLRHSGSTWHVLSRVCDAGRDYSGRTNKFAHHLVLTPQELPPGGPAWLAMQPGVFETQWDGQIGILNGARPLPHGDVEPEPCRLWAEIAGDAGWAGLLAETALSGTPKPAYLIAPPTMNTLALFAEALALLPSDRRWKIGFTTYFCDQFPPELDVPWKVYIEGTPAAEAALRRRHCLVINLLAPQPVPEETSAVAAAREGRRLVEERPTVVGPKHPVTQAAARPLEEFHSEPPPMKSHPPSFDKPPKPSPSVAPGRPSPVTPAPLSLQRDRRPSPLPWLLLVTTFLLVLCLGGILGYTLSSTRLPIARGEGKGKTGGVE
ncbi:MAG: hypothetical protein D6741_21360, partial [Planctomycetota bacterium]